jgi:hypothetical protein
MSTQTILQMIRSFLPVALASAIVILPGQAQSLADLARQEKEKREKQKASDKVFTNEDLEKYQPISSPVEKNTPAPGEGASPTPASTRPQGAQASEADSQERAWSKRFIEAKAKLQSAKDSQASLQAKLNDLNVKLMQQSDVYDREHLYAPLITQTTTQLAKSKEEVTAAEKALEDLREELRKSGQPASWQDSQLALKPETAPSKSQGPQTRDQKYWQERLALIDKRYEELIAPLNEERFQLISRRTLREGETAPAVTTTGMGLPPRVIDIDIQIRDLNQKRQQEKNALIEDAVRQGAMPGWFR